MRIDDEKESNGEEDPPCGPEDEGDEPQDQPETAPEQAPDGDEGANQEPAA